MGLWALSHFLARCTQLGFFSNCALFVFLVSLLRVFSSVIINIVFVGVCPKYYWAVIFFRAIHSSSKISFQNRPKILIWFLNGYFPMHLTIESHLTYYCLLSQYHEILLYFTVSCLVLILSYQQSFSSHCSSIPPDDWVYWAAHILAQILGELPWDNSPLWQPDHLLLPFITYQLTCY